MMLFVVLLLWMAGIPAIVVTLSLASARRRERLRQDRHSVVPVLDVTPGRPPLRRRRPGCAGSAQRVAY